VEFTRRLVPHLQAALRAPASAPIASNGGAGRVAETP
jgi:hypothetical protein